MEEGETYDGIIITSPSNHYVLACSTLTGGDFYVFNNRVYNMDDGTFQCMVNEQNFVGLNRTNIYSPAYENMITQMQATGADPVMLANDTFSVVLDGGTPRAGVPVWSVRDTFFVGYTLYLRSATLGWEGQDTFWLEFELSGNIRSYGWRNFA